MTDGNRNGGGEAYPANGRVVLHVDMNAFYCSVHEAEEPDKYAGKPTAVAGSVELRKGIIVTSSYAARRRGVKTGMTVREGLQRCRELILITPDFDLYRQYSRGFLGVVRQYTPLVESVSIDECYLDITGSKQFGTPLEIADAIQSRIRSEWTLPCSIGIAPNKLLAKIASDMKKPNGVTVLRLRDVPRLLWDKPCDSLFGVGRKTAEKLRRMNLHTIGQLAAADELLLVKQFGVHGHWLKSAAYGIDHSPVNPVREKNKSIGHTTTLPQDVTHRGEAHRILLNLADQTARRLRRQKLMASGVQITIRTPDMKTITRSATLPVPVESADVIHAEACRLYDRHWRADSPVRLLGITLQGLKERDETVVQLDLFDYGSQPKKEALIRAMDALRDKFGENAVLTAGMLGDDPSTRIRNHRIRGTSLQLDEHLLYIDD
ncbi:DNA polymerase IV [Paenibacillus darwinianus]|uniref:DNA polymerase IV n=1 Tax=Paenibacillus darwinianus TaxID=1380763 RepID=A0A9W5S0W1_9BACL|nr:DNA polymerase IV [Paenibacillus darwinianus]EXX86985.1 DNA polymerase IV [Paenibacillus darwinianus]EXX87187.1 DNA polymerase IV [Paenibacillus darwinianus]EXX87219.1 DNA polymerase IV [Paenibacillus darwinianus]